MARTKRQRRASAQKACRSRDCGNCPSCRMRVLWAAGHFAARRKTPMWDAWTPPQDQALRRLAGAMTVPELAERLTAEFEIPRTAEAVRIRAVRLGISTWRQGLSMRELETLFGLDHRAIVRWWITPGLLAAQRWNARGQYEGWLFDEVEIERFIRECGWAYWPEHMQTGHRLTRLAEIQARIDRWLTVPQVAQALDLCRETVCRWIRAGRIHGARRRPGASCKGDWVVPGRLLTELAGRSRKAAA